MRRGTCVKCGASDVRAARNGIVIGDHPQTLLRPDIGPGFRGMARSQPADLWAYGCPSCGYVELYVMDATGRAFMEQTWSPASEAGDAPPS
jgi:hypothetical protein